jgi:hypothetical protein
VFEAKLQIDAVAIERCYAVSGQIAVVKGLPVPNVVGPTDGLTRNAGQRT